MLKSVADMTKRERVFCIALRVLIALTLIFIFIQSALSPAASGQESDAVAGFLSLIFSSDGFIIRNIRQIAHFMEYGILGVELSLYVCFFTAKIKSAAIASLGIAQSVALLDETLQMFSGRTADIVDIWTDFLGFITLSLITYLVFFAYIKLKTKKDDIDG